ncbi:MAG: hypothetical protein LBP67_09065 [Bacteroidales bacterium]|nr:hypothetical protein [Bacteroidales bacterium]
MSGSIIDTTVGAGYKGIIVFRRASDGYPDDFICFDRACTSDGCNYYNKIELGRFDIFAKCPVCGTQYDLLSYGWPTTSNAEGNKSNPLQQYSTYFSGRHVVVENK